MIDTKVITVPLESGGKPEKINQVVIQKGLTKQVVLYWYQERGRIFPNEYWGRFYLVKDALTLHRTDGALVRISALLDGSIENTVNKELRFIRNLTPMLSDYIPGRNNASIPSSPRTFIHSFQENLDISQTGLIRKDQKNG
jgi:EpsI family protein